MRYKIGSNIIIKTENAAKPEAQHSAYLTKLIKNLYHVSNSFDYGCGKLRYKDPMLCTSNTLTVVDSSVQISRRQVICGDLTTIRETAQFQNRLFAHSVTEFA